MKRKKINLILTFVFSFLIQVFVFNEILFFDEGYYPIVYFFPILYYPYGFNRIYFLLNSFFLGLCMDIFTGMWGIFSFTIVLMAYFRPLILRTVFGMIFNDSQFYFFKLNFIQTLIYTLSFIFLHHLVLFYIEFHSLDNIGNVMTRIIITTGISTLVILVLRNLFLHKIEV